MADQFDMYFSNQESLGDVGENGDGSDAGMYITELPMEEPAPVETPIKPVVPASQAAAKKPVASAKKTPAKKADDGKDGKETKRDTSASSSSMDTSTDSKTPSQSKPAAKDKPLPSKDNLSAAVASVEKPKKGTAVAAKKPVAAASNGAGHKETKEKKESPKKPAASAAAPPKETKVSVDTSSDKKDAKKKTARTMRYLTLLNKGATIDVGQEVTVIKEGGEPSAIAEGKIIKLGQPFPEDKSLGTQSRPIKSSELKKIVQENQDLRGCIAPRDLEGFQIEFVYQQDSDGSYVIRELSRAEAGESANGKKWIELVEKKNRDENGVRIHPDDGFFFHCDLDPLVDTVAKVTTAYMADLKKKRGAARKKKDDDDDEDSGDASSEKKRVTSRKRKAETDTPADSVPEADKKRKTGAKTSINTVKAKDFAYLVKRLASAKQDVLKFIEENPEFKGKNPIDVLGTA